MRIVVMANPWTADDARAWSRRVPRLLRLLATPAALVAGVAFSIVGSSGDSGGGIVDAATAQSPGYLVWTLESALVLAALVLCWAVPRGGAITGLLGSLALATQPDEDTRLTWAVVAVALTLIVAADALRLVQQTLAVQRAPSGPPIAAALDPGLVASVGRTSVRHRLLVAALVAAALGGTLLFWYDDHAARAFRARAHTLEGTVTAITDDATVAVVDLGGATARVPILDVPRIGTRVRVTTDGARAELADDVFDPSGALAITTVGALGAGWLVGAERLRRARLAALLAGAPGIEAVLVAELDDRLVLAPVDDPRPLLALRVVDPHGRVAAQHAPDPDPSALLAALSDEDLLARARLALARAAADPHTHAGPAWPAGSRVTLVRLVDDLSPVAVLGPDGTWALAPAPVLAPRRGDLRAAEDAAQRATGTTR